jgi:hypothetical protein
MRINLKLAEVSALRNALATRHDDLRDLIAQWEAEPDAAGPDQVEAARLELDVVVQLGARIAGS